jgi:DnaJ-class molecular chaperone
MTCGVCQGAGKILVVASTCQRNDALVTCPNCQGHGVVMVAR